MGSRARVVGLRMAMLLVAVNVWTGSPLAALWVGSRVARSGPPQMGPIFVVVVALAVFSAALMWLLARLDFAYRRLTGQEQHVQRHVAWLRSMRGERPQYPGADVNITALEKTLVAVVVAAVLAFEIWFFFFSTSPIDQRSGRGAVPHASRGAGTRLSAKRVAPALATITSAIPAHWLAFRT